MGELTIYLLKSSGLIAAFFLSYHLLLRKETFFTSNRWFLLAGLLTSVVLPLFFIKKIVWVERPKMMDVADFTTTVQQTGNTMVKSVPPNPIDWMQIALIGYALVVLVLVLKIAFNIISLFRLLHNQKVEKQETFAMVDLQENIAPFSFFNFIVFNSSLYTPSEMESILLHEKVHSQQKHSFDMLVAKIFCVLFWFNPFVWLYKKAIIQNLEYIADYQAVQRIQDKKVYQKALLKVVTHQHCLPITNHFYQSLIKKRIVMLNKNQSRSTSYVKFAVVIPVLIAFVLLFQVKVIARDKLANEIIRTASKTNLSVEVIPQCETTPVVNATDVAYIFDKISSDNEIKNGAKDLKENHNIDLVVSKLKRNNKGEIIAIKISFNDNKGNVGKVEQDRTIPIRPIFFKVSKTPDGKNSIGFYDNPEMIVKPLDPILENKIVTIESIKDDALIYVDGDRYDKEFLNELDPKGLEKIEILKDPASLQQYGAQDKGEVVVITTNWTTKPAVPKQNAPSIFTLENGDEIVVFDRFNMKIPGYPAVQFTDSFPVLIYNGVQQKNPRLALESMNLSKIKNIKVFTENDKEVKGAPIFKMIVSTK